MFRYMLRTSYRVYQDSLDMGQKMSINWVDQIHQNIEKKREKRLELFSIEIDSLYKISGGASLPKTIT